MTESTTDNGTVEGMVYEQREGQHLIQLHQENAIYEFEIEDEEVAAGLKGIGEQILSEMDSPLVDAALSPSEVDRRERALSENDGDEEA